MDARTLCFAMVIALGVALWPILGQQAKVNAGWLACIVMGGATLVVIGLVLGVFSKTELGNLPSKRDALFLLAAGLTYGVAAFLYFMKAADPGISVPVLVTTVSVLSVMFSAGLNWTVTGIVPTAQEVAGYVSAATAIYLFVGVR